MSEESSQNTQSLGEQLSAARESLSLSQKELASRLNLKEDIIVALDSDDFDALPAPTYVMGYIRSYARAVNLDANILIDLYEGAAEAPPEILPDVKPPVQASSRDKPVRAFTYLISFTLVILLVAWLQGENLVGTGNLFSSQEVRPSAGGEYPGGFSYTFDVVIHPDVVVQEAEPIIETAVSESAIEAATDMEMSESLELTDDSSTTTQSTSPQNVTMELTAESWVEVFDGQGEKLYRDLAKPGETLNLSGVPPLSVKLGNARGVKVTYNGEIYDTGDFSKAGVARFVLK